MDFPARQVWRFVLRRTSFARPDQRTDSVTLTDLVLTQMDYRSFSNIWYWLAVMVTWATVTHWVIGVPFDLIYAARRHGGPWMADLEQMTAINLRRLATLDGAAGIVIVALGAFVVTSAAMLGFVYKLELAQALFCLAFPLSLVGIMTWRKVRRLRAAPLAGEALARALLSLRFGIQAVAMASIFLTAVLGVYVNLTRLMVF
jgi:hypothetical protein